MQQIRWTFEFSVLERFAWLTVLGCAGEFCQWRVWYLHMIVGYLVGGGFGFRRRFRMGFEFRVGVGWSLEDMQHGVDSGLMLLGNRLGR